MWRWPAYRGRRRVALDYLKEAERDAIDTTAALAAAELREGIARIVHVYATASFDRRERR